MSSSLLLRTAAIIALTPAADYTTKEGYTVNVASGTATLSTSATTPVRGVILEGAATTGKATVGILGSFEGTAKGKLSGTVTAGDRLQQAADGTLVTDAGTGSRVIVGVAIEDGVSGDLIEVAWHVPLTLS